MNEIERHLWELVKPLLSIVGLVSLLFFRRRLAALFKREVSPKKEVMLSYPKSNAMTEEILRQFFEALRDQSRAIQKISDKQEHLANLYDKLKRDLESTLKQQTEMFYEVRQIYQSMKKSHKHGHGTETSL